MLIITKCTKKLTLPLRKKHMHQIDCKSKKEQILKHKNKCINTYLLYIF